ncbi:MAG: hypothetical protein AAGB03_10565 [Pseudomonadota bacterium]
MTESSVMKRLFALGALLAVAACVSPAVDPQVVETASYQNGYADGCRTANERTNGLDQQVVRNEAIYDTNENYRLGWRSGYGACGGGAGNETPGVFNEDQWF